MQYEKFRYETAELGNGLHALILHYDTLHNTLALQTVRTIQLLLELCNMAYFFKQGTVYTKRIDSSDNCRVFSKKYNKLKENQKAKRGYLEYLKEFSYV